MDSGSEENVASRIVGATKRKLRRLVYLEGLGLTAAGSLTGILLHKILTPVLFSKLNVIDGVEYSVLDYLNVFVIILLLSSLIVFIFTRKYVDVSLAAVRQRG